MGLSRPFLATCSTYTCINKHKDFQSCVRCLRAAPTDVRLPRTVSRPHNLRVQSQSRVCSWAPRSPPIFKRREERNSRLPIQTAVCSNAGRRSKAGKCEIKDLVWTKKTHLLQAHLHADLPQSLAPMEMPRIGIVPSRLEKLDILFTENPSGTAFHY